MGNLLCMGLILRFPLIPSPRVLDSADHSPPAGVYMDVLDRDLLLTLAAMFVEGIEQRRSTRNQIGRSFQRPW
jgi:hypothetical protein